MKFKIVALSLAVTLALGELPSVSATAGEPLVVGGQVVFESATAAKAPDSLLSRAARGESQDIIVIFDDSAIQDQTAAFLGAEGKEEEPAPEVLSEMLTFKADGYAALKATAAAGLVGSGVEVLREYRYLPYSFMRVSGVEAMQRLLKSPQVKRVAENGRAQLALAQSLPLVHQPQAAALGHQGNGTTIAILDTGVDFTRPEFGSCTAPGQPASCRVAIAEDIASDDGQLDDDGHGTVVSAIASATAPLANLVVLDVYTSDGTGIDGTDVISAIDRVIEIKSTTQRRIVALNMSFYRVDMSWSDNCDMDEWAEALGLARDAYIQPVACTGNQAFIDGISSPACISNVAGVGAVYDANVGGRYYKDPGSVTLTRRPIA